MAKLGLGGTTMAKSSSSSSSSSSSAAPFFAAASPAIQIKNMSEEHLDGTIKFFNQITGSAQIPDDFSINHFHSDLTRAHLRQRGRASCILSVKPAVCNLYGSLHGGFVAAAAEFLSTACARTVVAEDKNIFLGEFSISYLSAASQNAEVVIDASVIRSGRSLTVVAVEFKLKETGKLIYTAQSTFYNMPTAKF